MSYNAEVQLGELSELSALQSCMSVKFLSVAFFFFFNLSLLILLPFKIKNWIVLNSCRSTGGYGWCQGLRGVTASMAFTLFSEWQFLRAFWKIFPALVLIQTLWLTCSFHWVWVNVAVGYQPGIALVNTELNLAATICIWYQIVENSVHKMEVKY